MNLQQFRFIRETIRRNFNLTEASRVLFTSQPGISKAIIEFEDELGLQVFERHGKRIKGLTKPGFMIAQIIEDIMKDVDNLKKLSDNLAHIDEGSLVIGCTHTQARYYLPKLIVDFKQRYPKIHVSLAEGNPTQLAQMLLQEQADVALATETLSQVPGILTLSSYTWEHVLVMKPEHPLADLTSSEARRISLAQIAEYPIVTYDRAFAGRSKIDQAFAEACIVPDIVLEAIDADVIKTYVDVGLGVGIIASVAFDPRRDPGFVGIPVGHLFGPNLAKVGIRKGTFVRDFLFDFLSMCSPGLTRSSLNEAMQEQSQAPK